VAVSEHLIHDGLVQQMRTVHYFYMKGI
jgi:hypothetical protein